MKKHVILACYLFIGANTSLYASLELSDFQKHIPNRVKQYIFTFLGDEKEQKRVRVICKNWHKLINDNLKRIDRDTIRIRKNKELFALLQNDKEKLKYLFAFKDPTEITSFVIEKLPEVFKFTEVPDVIKIENSSLFKAISCFSNLKSFIVFPSWFCRNYKYNPKQLELSQTNFKKTYINQMFVNCLKEIKTLTHIEMPFFIRPSIGGNYYNMLREYIRILATHPKLETVTLPIQFTDIAVFWAVFHNMSLQKEAKKTVINRIKELRIEEFFPFKDVHMFPLPEFINAIGRDWKLYLSPFKCVEKISLNYPPTKIIEYGVSNLFKELFAHHKIRELDLLQKVEDYEKWQDVKNALNRLLEEENYEVEIDDNEQKK